MVPGRGHPPLAAGTPHAIALRGLRAGMDFDDDVAAIRALAAAGARVISIGPEAVTLEQAFLEVTK